MGKTNQFIIDRFEGDFAVIELDTLEIVNLPKKLVPDDAKEGDVLVININTEETKKRKERIRQLTEDLWE